MLTPSDLKAARENSGPAAYQEFALHTRQGRNGLFCFFEGKAGSDNSYYVPRIRSFIKDYHPIRCGGRETVLRAHRMIISHSEYNKYKKAFFIDRDFNPPLPTYDPPIFETPCYSIENFYVSEDVFREILKNVFKISETENEFNELLSLFIKRQKEFHRATILFNSWYACLIDIRNRENKKTGVNLSNKLPDGFVSISLDQVSANYNLEKIKLTFPNALMVSGESLSAKFDEFHLSDQHKTFRGKYEMQFLLTFFDLLVQDSLNAKLHTKDKISLSFGSKMTNDQAINILSGYAESPPSLIEYLALVSS